MIYLENKEVAFVERNLKLMLVFNLRQCGDQSDI